MTNMNGNIVSLSDAEVEEVDGGLLMGVAAVVGIAAGLVYIGGELHDALCRDH
jgi:hypothetical protein